MTHNIKRNWFIYIFLVFITLVVYSRVVEFELLHFDDNTYVTDNPNIRQGITPAAIKWAVSGKYEANWIPLTWVSYMLDYQGYARSWPGFGPDEASVYHRTNLILHVLNTLLLFLVLGLLTGSRWKSTLAAAVFAVHPLHVESVAWVAERKDVLSTFFMMLTLLGYLWYVKRPGTLRYAPTLAAFLLGLMSKSMLVTLPILLLLLDFWPLKRLGSSDDAKAHQGLLRRLIIEKAPFFAASLAVGIVTMLVQERGEALRSLAGYPMGERLANAAVSGVAYIGKMLWPVKLSCFYPHPHDTLPVWQVVAAVAALTGITLVAFRVSKRLPHVTVGWLWYLVTLLPVIGIIQVGAQAMADRYTYVPMIGISIAVIWGLAEAVRQKMRYKTRILAAVSCVVLVGLMARAHSQVSVWRDDITLFSHAVTVTPGNSQMEYNLANSYLNLGEDEKAAEHFRRTVEINPYDAEAHNNLAMILLQMAEEKGADEADAYEFQGARFSRAEIDQARQHFAAAARLLPGTAGPHRYLACVLMIQGDLDGAIAEFEAALKVRPDSGTEEALREAMAAREAARKNDAATPRTERER